MSNKKPRKKIPPDGGWGWMVVFAQALSNMVSLPILSAFGLIFKDKLSELGMSVKDISTITSTNAAFTMLIGVVNGPILKTFGYRKVALLAGTMFATGLALTAFANSFWYFILSYSILLASGFGLVSSSFSLALNTYFLKKRGRAVGAAVTVAGLGPILYPPLITALLSYFDVQDCALILACLSLHIIVAALMLQPIKYHWVYEASDEELATGTHHAKEISLGSGSNNAEQTSIDATTLKSNEPDSNGAVKQTVKQIPQLMTLESTERYRSCGFDNPTYTQMESIDETVCTNSDDAVPEEEVCTNSDDDVPEEEVCTESDDAVSKLDAVCTNSDDAISKLEVVCTKSDDAISKLEVVCTKSDDAVPKLETNLKNVSPKDDNKAPNKNSILSGLVSIFDLDLLVDLRFLNIIAGMAIATFAELSFGSLMPFILSEMHFSDIEIATCLSTLSIADISSRFLSPFIGEYLIMPNKVMYLVGLFFLIVFRMSILLCDSLTKLLVIAACIGFAKGIRTVYLILIIPNYVPIDKLASALGIRMVSNGVMVLCFGPLVGWIRDFSGNYALSIGFINCLTFICIIMWGAELLYDKFKYKSTDDKIQ